MSITLTRGDDLARIDIDDGKANAFDSDVFRQLGAALDDCTDAGAIVIAGREGAFSGGLNLKVLQSLDQQGLFELLVQFARTMHRIWLEPRPVVAAATGHAVAGGTVLAMTCDHAVAAAGNYRWGLNETAIGMVVPEWLLTIARANVPAHRLDGLILSGSLIAPEAAVEAGLAHEVVPPEQVIAVAEEKARALAALPRQAYAGAKQRLRGPASAQVLAVLEDDVKSALGMS